MPITNGSRKLRWLDASSSGPVLAAGARGRCAACAGTRGTSARGSSAASSRRTGSRRAAASARESRRGRRPARCRESALSAGPTAARLLIRCCSMPPIHRARQRRYTPSRGVPARAARRALAGTRVRRRRAPDRAVQARRRRRARPARARRWRACGSRDSARLFRSDTAALPRRLAGARRAADRPCGSRRSRSDSGCRADERPAALTARVRPARVEHATVGQRRELVKPPAIVHRLHRDGIDHGLRREGQHRVRPEQRAERERRVATGGIADRHDPVDVVPRNGLAQRPSEVLEHSPRRCAARRC